MAIYYRLKEIPQPEGSHINHSDGRVYIYLYDKENARDSKRMTIGKATSETMMSPNENFKFKFPNLWEEYYGTNEIKSHFLQSGMYGLTLGIGHHTNLYPLLQETYGPSDANTLMDYSMYSILYKSDVSMTYQESMKDKVIFSRKAQSDSYLSTFFKEDLTEKQCLEFKRKWMTQCIENGTTRAWISIDGTNENCEAKKCSLAEKGKAKSNKNVSIVGYMYAVNAEDGTPITYSVYNGNKVDSKAFKGLIKELEDYGIGVEGVLLDRGFADSKVIKIIEELGYPYVIMLKSSAYGHNYMLNKYSETIRWKVPYVVNKKGMFGIQEKTKIFKSSDLEANINLFYDGANGGERSIKLINKVVTIMDAIEDGESVRIPKELSKYFIENENNEISFNYDVWQQAIDIKGYSSIASSEDYTPKQINEIYHLRDASEKQYSIMKSQLGYNVTRVHYTNGVKNKFLACFIASIIRNEILKASIKLDLTTNVIIKDINRIILRLQPNGIYTAIHDESRKALDTLKNFDILDVDFDSIARDVTNRSSSKINSQLRLKPEHEVKRKGPGRPKGSTSRIKTEKSKSNRKPGRPKGSKNKKK